MSHIHSSNTKPEEKVRKYLFANGMGTYSRETAAAINALIQSSFSFKKGNANTNKPTAERILIFDEAQRVWNNCNVSI